MVFQPLDTTGNTDLTTTLGRVNDYLRGLSNEDTSNILAVTGAVTDGINDDAPAIQSAIDTLYALGGGIVQLDGKTYGIKTNLILKPNVSLQGVGKYKTTLRVLIDNIAIINTHGFAKSGMSFIRGIGFEGYADRNATQGTVSLVRAGPFERLDFDDNRVQYSRHMGVSSTSDVVNASRNTVNRCHRDGINFTDGKYVRVQDNDISEIGDDAIAVHISQTATGIWPTSVHVTGNRLEKCLGIKCLGARHTVIANNRLRFYAAYGVNVGGVEAPEGYANKFSINISDNSFVDGLNGTSVGVGSNAHAILITHARSLGSSPDTIPAYVGEYDSGTTAIIKPDAFFNKAGSTIPRASAGEISIVGNSVRQTIDGIVNFSDAGFGTLYSTAGVVDPALTTLIRVPHGMTLFGDFSNVSIMGNTMHGVSAGIRFKNFDVLSNIVVAGNTVTRFDLGVSFDVAAERFVKNVAVRGNAFDGDPYFENADHLVAGAGVWANTGSQGGSCMLGLNVKGVSFTQNSVRNVRKVIHASNTSSHAFNIEANDYHYDFVNNKGIGLMDFNSGRPMLNNHFYVDSTPTSGTYGQASSVSDSAYVKSATSIPTAGFFRAGQMVLNGGTLTISASKVLIGWRRITTGSAHVSGTDWSPVMEYAT